MAGYSMNKQRQRHMSGEESGDVKQSSGQHHPPHIHIHHDGGKVHVHIMHHSEVPERHEHEPSDTEAIKSHIDEHYGQDHGFSGGEAGEEEGSLI